MTARSPRLKRDAGVSSSVERTCVCTVPNHWGGEQVARDASDDAVSESEGSSTGRTRSTRTVSAPMTPPRQATCSRRAVRLVAQSSRSPSFACGPMTQAACCAHSDRAARQSRITAGACALAAAMATAAPAGRAAARQTATSTAAAPAATGTATTTPTAPRGTLSGVSTR